MTQDEADKIAKAVETVDDNCESCARNLCDELNDLALGFTWKVVEWTKDDGYHGWKVTAEPCASP
jgi:hypothetical protein